MSAAVPTESLSNPSREEILARMQTLLAEILSLENAASITEETRFLEDLNLDSLAMVDIIIALEEGFGLKLRSDTNIFELATTVGAAVDLIADLKTGHD